MAREQATLGGGCFWCLEAVYQRLEGVSTVVSGYIGGKSKDPTYEEICTGLTGHAEVVQLTFDAAVVTFVEILEIFWTIHDPTTLNRQGNDVGTQYRSAIFYHNDQQKVEAEKSIKDVAAKLYSNDIVTEVTALEKFYTAEDYHQNYFNDNPGQGYCSFIVEPKVLKFKEKFGHRLKTSA